MSPLIRIACIVHLFIDEEEMSDFSSVKKGRELTPSKILREPESKRACQKDRKSVSRPSGRFCKQRQERFQALLHANFVESSGKVRDKQSVLSVLELDEQDKRLATRAIHKSFPAASIDRRDESFKNIRKVASFEIKTDAEELFPLCGTDLSNIRALLAESRQKNAALLEEIISRVKDHNTENIHALLDAHKKQSDLVTHFSEKLDKLYEKEITLLMKEKEKPSLSESDKLQIKKEVHALSNSVNFGVRSREKSSDVIVDENIFEILVEKVSHEFPLPYDIVKTLFPSDNIKKRKGQYIL